MVTQIPKSGVQIQSFKKSYRMLFPYPPTLTEILNFNFLSFMSKIYQLFIDKFSNNQQTKWIFSKNIPLNTLIKNTKKRKLLVISSSIIKVA